MKNVRRLAALFILSVFLAGVANATTSTVNPNVPSQNSPLTSSVVRGNFSAAYNDITALFGISTVGANQVLGGTVAGLAYPLSLPSCSSGTSALTWTTGTGFGCNTIAGGGSGTVTSVTLTGDSVLYSGTPTGAVTSSGTLPLTLLTQSHNTVLAGSTTGGTVTPGFRLLVGADLPNPGVSSLGGVQSIAAVSHNFLTSISTSGIPAQAQPAFSDISGSVTNAQLASLSANQVLGAVTATTPSGLTLPSCSGGNSALTYTLGSGFGCNTIAGGSGSPAGSASEIQYRVNGTTFGAAALQYNATTLGLNFDATHNAIALPASGTDLTSLAIGPSALVAQTVTGANNIGIGSSALSSLSSGTGNTALGAGAGAALTTDVDTTFVGFNAGHAQNLAATTTGGNTAVGYGALQTTVTGYGNTAIGYLALAATNFGGNAKNTAVGYGSLSQVTGVGTQATAIGYLSCFGLTTGLNNTCLGASSGQLLSTGSNNVLVGATSTTTIMTGSGNVTMGSNANTALGSTSSSIAIGFNAKAGSTDVAIGTNALSSTSTNSGGNVAVGYQAGMAGVAITTGTGNTFIGNQAQANSATAINRTAIGNGAISVADNDIILGNSSIATIHSQVTSITAISDRRHKKNIEPIDLGLDFIMKLKPVRYSFNNGDNTVRFGLIAQDAETALPNKYQSIIEDKNPKKALALIQIENNKEQTYTLNYGELTAPTIRAIQELQAEVDNLKKQLARKK